MLSEVYYIYVYSVAACLTQVLSKGGGHGSLLGLLATHLKKLWVEHPVCILYTWCHCSRQCYLHSSPQSWCELCTFYCFKLATSSGLFSTTPKQYWEAEQENTSCGISVELSASSDSLYLLVCDTRKQMRGLGIETLAYSCDLNTVAMAGQTSEIPLGLRSSQENKKQPCLVKIYFFYFFCFVRNTSLTTGKQC